MADKKIVIIDDEEQMCRSLARSLTALILLRQKLLDSFNLEVEVMRFGFWSELDFFGLNNRLFLFGLLLFFLQLIPVLVEIHDSTDRRIGLSGNFNQIQILIVCNFQGFLCGEHTALFAVCINKPNFRVLYRLVDLNLNLLLLGKFPASSFNVCTLLLCNTISLSGISDQIYLVIGCLRLPLLHIPDVPCRQIPVSTWGGDCLRYACGPLRYHPLSHVLRL